MRPGLVFPCTCLRRLRHRLQPKTEQRTASQTIAAIPFASCSELTLLFRNSGTCMFSLKTEMRTLIATTRTVVIAAGMVSLGSNEKTEPFGSFGSDTGTSCLLREGTFP